MRRRSGWPLELDAEEVVDLALEPVRGLPERLDAVDSEQP
jgi:hypothetical protein